MDFALLTSIKTGDVLRTSSIHPSPLPLPSRSSPTIQPARRRLSAILKASLTQSADNALIKIFMGFGGDKVPGVTRFIRRSRYKAKPDAGTSPPPIDGIRASYRPPPPIFSRRVNKNKN